MSVARRRGAGSGSGERAGGGARGESLRGLAAVDEVLREPAVAALTETYPRGVVVEAVRTLIERLRREIMEGGREGDAVALSPARLVPWVEKLVAAAVSPSLRRVINATGSSPTPTSAARCCRPKRGRRSPPPPVRTAISRSTWPPASAPRASVTCATCSALSPARPTPWRSTTTPPPYCWRWRPRAVTAR